jgi:branched-chain amino acid transport system ATP-binding protein
VTVPDATTNGAGPALVVDGVLSGYGHTTVLRDVSLVVPAGEAVALLGPNGAGKTTLLRTVSGFLPALEGSIRMRGVDVTDRRPHARAGAGLCHVPEGRGIFRRLSVRENLIMQSRRGEEAEAQDRAIAAFPILGERLEQDAGTLSGGEQQMLALAAAYARRPSLVLVDEVSLGLAPIVLDEIFAFLSELSASGTSLLLVDQFAERALELAGNAYVLRRGTVAYDGPSATLLESDIFDQYLGVDANA